MQAQRLPAARGAFWLAAGFALYRRNPLLLGMLTLGYLMIVVAFGLLQPIGQFLMPLALPALTVLVANGFRALDLAPSRTLPRGVLASGLAEHRGALLRLGALHLAGTMAVLAADLMLEGGHWSSLTLDTSDETAQIVHMLRLMALASPLLLAFWFAPLLTAWEGVTAAKSMFFSFIAAWRNWRAFLAYGLAVTLIGVFLPGLVLLLAGLLSATLGDILSMALRLLLILVFAPVLMVSIYLSYRDVFVPTPAAHE